MHMDDEVKAKLIKNIDSAPDDPNSDLVKEELRKAAIVMHIIDKTVFSHSSEVVKGAHVIVPDGGELYDELVKQNLVQNRISSHHRGNKGGSDASIQGGEIFREFLVGKTKDGKTWFQVEGHSTGGLANFIGHMVDYLCYKFTGQNIGQYGSSKHLDSNPINAVKVELDNIKSALTSHIEPGQENASPLPASLKKSQEKIR